MFPIVLLPVFMPEYPVFPWTARPSVEVSILLGGKSVKDALTKVAVDTGVHLVCRVGVVRAGVSRASTVLVLCVGVSGVHAGVHSSSAGSTGGTIGVLSTSI